MKGNVIFDGQGILTDFLQSMPGMNERARNSALASIGFKLKKEAKSAVGGNVFQWPKISNLTQVTRAYPANRNSATRSRAIIMDKSQSKKAWGVLANLLVYSVEKDAGELQFGFLAGTFGKKWAKTSGGKKKVDNVIGDSTIVLARKITEGFDDYITPKKQRYFAAIGFFFQAGRILKIPARPLIGPVFVMSKPVLPKWFADKFWERLRKYAGGK